VLYILIKTAIMDAFIKADDLLSVTNELITSGVFTTISGMDAIELVGCVGSSGHTNLALECKDIDADESIMILLCVDPKGKAAVCYRCLENSDPVLFRSPANDTWVIFPKSDKKPGITVCPLPSS
jgi:hypothetical protein